VITMVDMNMWIPFAIGRRKLRRLSLVVRHRVLVVLVLEDLIEVLLVQRYRSCSCHFIVLHPSTPSGVIGSVTQSSVLTDSTTASQSSTLGPHSAHFSGTYH
jgi:hypothetical protein